MPVSYEVFKRTCADEREAGFRVMQVRAMRIAHTHGASPEHLMALLDENPPPREPSEVRAEGPT
mgnify:CR=1 FL=1